MKKITRREFIRQGGVYAGAAAMTASGLSDMRLLAQGIERTRIYILNLDGMPAAYLGYKYQGESLTPNLNALMAKGTTFTNCCDVLPALTATNHIAIISSAPTSKSGILGAGGFYAGMDEKGRPVLKLFEKKHCLVETIYEVIKRQSPQSKTAVLSGKNWMADLFQGDPANSAVDIKVNGKSYPDYISPPESYILGGPYQAGEDVSRFRLQVSAPGEKWAEGCIGGFLSPEDFPSDEWIIGAAIEVVKREDPVFMYVLLAGTDDCGHAYGNFADGDICTLANYDAMRGQMRIADAAVGRFIQFLTETDRLNSSIIVVTADHGMTTMEEHLEIDFGGIKKMDVTKLLKTFNQIGSLSVDIRAILAKKGFPIRASDGITPYNPSGVYDTTFSEGPNSYIYRVNKELRPRIKQALLDWNEATPHKPIWKVLLPEEMRDEVNEYDGFPFRLLCEQYHSNPDAEVVWPDIIVFTHRHYMNTVYSDSLRAGTAFVMRKMPIPPGFKVNLIPGAHGSYADQKVPLVMVGGHVPAGGFVEGASISRKVSVLDILPTLCKLTGWQLPKDAEGSSLLLGRDFLRYDFIK